MKNAQQWINNKYPTSENKQRVEVLSINSLNKWWPFVFTFGRSNDYYLRIGEKELQGKLDLAEFVCLKGLCIRQNGINSIKLESNRNLTELVISGGIIEELNLRSQPNLTLLSISDANQLLLFDLSQNINLTSLLVERCKKLEGIEGLDRLVRLVFASIRDNPKLNSSDYERFCIADSPQSNIGLPREWKEFFDRHIEEINTRPKKVVWMLSGLSSEEAEQVWNNNWHDLTINSPEDGAGAITNIGNSTDYTVQNITRDLQQQNSDLQAQVNQWRERTSNTQGELLTQKIDIKKERLERFIQQLEINPEQIRTLQNTHEQLVNFRRQGYNQTELNNVRSNIEIIEQGLLDRGVSLTNVQKVSHKCEKIAELKWEASQINQQQFEARQGVAPQSQRW